MLDPSSAACYRTMIMKQPQFPEKEQLRCPRCDSTNTKFCYYNNYNMSQPRHFCKTCRRYWNKGGALRNIPVGGGSHKKTKRFGQHGSPSSSSSSSGHPKKTHCLRNPYPGWSSATYDPASSSSSTALDPLKFGSNLMARLSGIQDPTRICCLTIGDKYATALDIDGSFSSVLRSKMQLGGILDGLNENGSEQYPATGLQVIDRANSLR